MHKYHNNLAHEQIQICMHRIISQLTRVTEQKKYVVKKVILTNCWSNPLV